MFVLEIWALMLGDDVVDGRKWFARTLIGSEVN